MPSFPSHPWYTMRLHGWRRVEKPTEFKKSRDASPGVAGPRQFARVPKWRCYIILMVKQWGVAMNNTCHRNLSLACFMSAEVNPASEYAIVYKSSMSNGCPVCNLNKFSYKKRWRQLSVRSQGGLEHCKQFRRIHLLGLSKYQHFLKNYSPSGHPRCMSLFLHWNSVPINFSLAHSMDPL